jgi:hypothetical protein
LDNIFQIVMVSLGYGHHTQTIPTDKIIAIRGWAWATQTLYKISLQLVKISLLLFYNRIFGTVTWFKRLSYSLIGLISVFLVYTTITGIFQCQPVAKIWNQSLDGKCLPILAFFGANATFALITDCIILIMPLPLVSQLRIPFAQKMALIPVFLLGILVIICSTFREVALFTTLSVDFSYDLTGPLWVQIELNTAIICACLPSIRVLLARMFPNQFASSARPSVGGQGNSDIRTWGAASSKAETKGAIQLSSMRDSLDRDLSTEALNDSDTWQENGIHRTLHYKVERSVA